MVVLKRLSDARAAGDSIAAVIRGTAINHAGRSKASSAASGAAQEAVIRAALLDAGVEPREVGYVEAHGTGALLGDAIEVLALDRVYGASSAREIPLRLGTVKTNVGHLEGAAGVAGLIKTALCVSHGRIPPHLHLRQLNPRVSWHELAVKVVTDDQAWATSDGKRIAGVSSFGLSGTNAHVVLEQPPVVEAPAPAPQRSAELIVVSAKTAAALSSQLVRFADHLDRHPEYRLQDLAHGLLTSRAALEHRWAFAAASRGDLTRALRSAASTRRPPSSAASAAAQVAVAFVFPGSASRWLEVSRRLLEEDAAYRDAMHACDAAIRAVAGWSVLEKCAAMSESPELGRIELSGPLLFSSQVALAALWQAWGVKPDAVVGHGMGEVAAACVSGALTLQMAATIICRSSALLGRIRGQGEMALVELAADEVNAALAGLAAQVSIAAYNGRRSTVLSGARDALARVLAQLEAAGVSCRRLDLDVASHSPQVEPLLDELVRSLQDVRPMPGVVAMHSTVTGKLLTGSELTARYWADNLRQPVRFEESICWLLRERRVTHFIELSSHPLTTRGIEDIREELDAPGVVTGSLRDGTPDRLALLDALGALYRHGHPLDARALFRDGGRRVQLPNYAWQRNRYWLELPSEPRQRVAASHALLGARSSSPLAEAVFESVVSLRDLPWLGGYRVQGKAVLPVSGLMELIRMAGDEQRAGAPCGVSGLVLHAPLVVEDDERRRLQVVLSETGKQAAVYSRSAREDSAGEWTLHARATLHTAPGESFEHLDVQAGRARCTRSIDTDSVYASSAAVGVVYGPPFRGLRSLTAGSGEALAEVALPPGWDGGGFALHPALLESALQAAFGVLDARVEGQACLPFSIERYVLHRLRSTSLVVHVQARDGLPGAGLLLDLTLADPDGWIVGRVSGLQLRHMTPQVSPSASAWSAPGNASYRLEWLQTPLPARASALTGRWLVVADQAGEAIAGELRAAGAQAAAVELRHGVEPAAHVLCVCEASPDADGAIHAALRALALVRAHLDREHPPRIYWLTRAAVAAESCDEVDVGGSALWGFVRTLARERPGLSCKLLDLDPGAALVDVLLHEVEARDGENQIAWRAGRRRVARLTRIEDAPEVSAAEHDALISGRSDTRSTLASQPLAPRSHKPSTVLVTGGLAGLGAEVARMLAQRGTRHLLLMGQRGLETPGASLLVAELEAWGARATVVAGDVAVETDVANAMALIPPGAPLQGVVHAEGSLDDDGYDHGWVEGQTAERLTAAMAPQVRGAWHLHTLTRRSQLDFFVLCSSLASTLGTPGQAAHAAGSSFLDALASHRRGRGLPASSLAWGPWVERGVSATRHCPVHAKWRREGIEPLGAEQGRALFERALERPEPQLVLAFIDLHRLAKILEPPIPPIWRALLRSRPKSAAQNVGATESGVTAPARGHAPAVIDVVRAEAARASSSSSEGMSIPERGGGKPPRPSPIATSGAPVAAPQGRVAHCECINPLPAPRARLFGFHDAGGSPSQFVPFCRLGSDIEIHTVANARSGLADGMGERYLEQAVAYVRGKSDVPYVLFGHSLGGLFAWRVLKALQPAGVRLPSLLALSAAATPPVLARARSAEGRAELFNRVVGDRLRGLKSLRADFETDFALWWALPAADPEPVDVDIAAFAGRDDAVAGAHVMGAWQQATTAQFSLREFSGGHFYIIAEAGRAPMLEALGDKMRAL
jgi:myxalamid-type polyketide synthase MxaE and MxaD